MDHLGIRRSIWKYFMHWWRIRRIERHYGIAGRQTQRRRSKGYWTCQSDLWCKLKGRRARGSTVVWVWPYYFSKKLFLFCLIVLCSLSVVWVFSISTNRSTWAATTRVFVLVSSGITGQTTRMGWHVRTGRPRGFTSHLPHQATPQVSGLHCVTRKEQ